MHITQYSLISSCTVQVSANLRHRELGKIQNFDCEFNVYIRLNGNHAFALTPYIYHCKQVLLFVVLFLKEKDVPLDMDLEGGSDSPIGKIVIAEIFLNGAADRNGKHEFSPLLHLFTAIEFVK